VLTNDVFFPVCRINYIFNWVLIYLLHSFKQTLLEHKALHEIPFILQAETHTHTHTQNILYKTTKAKYTNLLYKWMTGTWDLLIFFYLLAILIYRN